MCLCAGLFVFVPPGGRVVCVCVFCVCVPGLSGDRRRKVGGDWFGTKKSMQFHEAHTWSVTTGYGPWLREHDNRLQALSNKHLTDPNIRLPGL